MKDKLRVLFPFVGDSVGGSHISALTLVRALFCNGVEPVVAVHQDGQLQIYLKKMGVQWLKAPNVPIVSPAPIPVQIFRMLKASISISRFLRRNKIDIVHTNDMRMHLTWALGIKIAGAKMVWHQRNPNPAQRISYYSRAANKVITISEHCKNNLPENMAARAHIIPSPVEFSEPFIQDTETKKRVQRELGVLPETLLIGWVANWMDRKRPQVFVDMAARIAGFYKGHVAFPMFGEPREPIRDKVLKRIREHGLEDNVMVMGSRTPIEPWIAGCDVLVATAVNEGQGRTLIEAMLVGTPVVAAAHGGHLEVIEDGVTGVLVPPDNPDALADAVLDLLAKPEKVKQIVTEAMRRAMFTYSVECHVKNVMDIYKFGDKQI